MLTPEQRKEFAICKDALDSLTGDEASAIDRATGKIGLSSLLLLARLSLAPPQDLRDSLFDKNAMCHKMKEKLELLQTDPDAARAIRLFNDDDDDDDDDFDEDDPDDLEATLSTYESDLMDLLSKAITGLPPLQLDDED